MPKVRIHDVVLLPREVELPYECPHCHADLREGGSDRQIVKATTYFVGHLLDPVPDNFDAICDNDVFSPHGLDGVGADIAPATIGYECRKCGNGVVEVREMWASSVLNERELDAVHRIVDNRFE